jgi:hypothetical protein
LFLRHDDDELKTGVLILMFNRLMSSMTIWFWIWCTEKCSQYQFKSII